MHKQLIINTSRFVGSRNLEDFKVGKSLNYVGFKTGRITLLYKEPAFIIVREDGSFYFQGIGLPQAWSSPAISLFTHSDSMVDCWDEVERIELHHGMKWRRIAKGLHEKYYFMQKA